jgi:hypothetical protein
MKKSFFTTGFILMAAILVCSSCKQQPKVQDNKGATAVTQSSTAGSGGFDAAQLKEQIIGIITTMPKPKELASYINEAGIPYILGLTVQPKDVEKYLTTVDQSLINGMYKFDALYAKTYKRYDLVMQLYDVDVKLMNKLGMEGEMSSLKKYETRLKQNSEKQDSLDVIVGELQKDLAAGYSAGEHSGIYGLTYVGANIEGLYVISQIAMMNKTNSNLIKIIGQQRERIQSNYKLLELMAADPQVAPLVERMKPILDYFTKNQEFTEKQLEEVAPMIEKLRMSIVK